MKRCLVAQVKEDLSRKMVLLAGPRQIGKTTLAKQLLASKEIGYLNYDVPADRALILKRSFPKSPLIVLDELHRFKTWRTYLKGLYDDHARDFSILVTGSARLDLFRRAGDSLQGRYHFLHMHPLSVAELRISTMKQLERLISLTGFPEPYFEGSTAYAKRWSHEYRSLMIRDEVQSLERVDDIGKLELLAMRLPELVGSPLSVNGLREDLEINHKTTQRWLNILERLYGMFRISPYGPPAIKAVKKAQKHYHFDWSLVPSPGAQFENLIAVHLLKWIDFERDTKGRMLELRYFRSVEGHEVDFVVLENRKPIELIECKVSDEGVDPSLRYLADKLPGVKATQVVKNLTRSSVHPKGIQVRSALDFLSELV